MAKKTDPFEKFRNATLGDGNSLSGALSGGTHKEEVDTPLPSSAPTAPTAPQVITPVATPAKVSKNATRKMVSFHVDAEIFRRLGQLKFEMGTKYDDLYNEAIRDLLVKYGKL